MAKKLAAVAEKLNVPDQLSASSLALSDWLSDWLGPAEGPPDPRDALNGPTPAGLLRQGEFVRPVPNLDVGEGGGGDAAAASGVVDSSASLARVGADATWEHSHKTIEFNGQVGKGAFGTVWRATRGGMPMAAKQIIINAVDYRRGSFFARVTGVDGRDGAAHLADARAAGGRARTIAFAAACEYYFTAVCVAVPAQTVQAARVD